MSQQDRFPIILGGVTAVVAVGLIYLGISATGKYNKAKGDYETAAGEVSSMQSDKLSPTTENRRAKESALRTYQESVANLQKAFDPYRTGDLALVDPAEFTAQLKTTRETVVKALTDANVTVPTEFFLGFESYTNSPARKEATGVLNFEMSAISELFTQLAAAHPVKINNVFRPALEEESGKVFDAKDKSYRALPVEISFNGNEASLRHFLSALDDSKKFYFVIRSLRVSNEMQKAPTAADANFSKPEEAEAAASGGGGDFGGGGFVLPGDEPATPDAGTPAAPAPAADEKILQHVLGSEKINVFLRIDILQFLKARDL